MASIHPTLRIEYYLEDHIDKVLEATPLHVTYKAYDRTSALLATSFLLARGYEAQFHISDNQPAHWHIEASN